MESKRQPSGVVPCPWCFAPHIRTHEFCATSTFPCWDLFHDAIGLGVANWRSSGTPWCLAMLAIGCLRDSLRRTQPSADNFDKPENDPLLSGDRNAQHMGAVVRSGVGDCSPRQGTWPAHLPRYAMPTKPRTLPVAEEPRAIGLCRGDGHNADSAMSNALCVSKCVIFLCDRFCPIKFKPRSWTIDRCVKVSRLDGL